MAAANPAKTKAVTVGTFPGRGQVLMNTQRPPFLPDTQTHAVLT